MTLSRRVVIAIDGPSGSGKSSTSRGVAQRLGLDYLDTGAMYRALTVGYLNEHLAPDDAHGIGDLAHRPIGIALDPAHQQVLFDGYDVTTAIRSPEVSASVSVVAANPEVRRILVRLQRSYIETSERGIVVEGRDITTVVAPDADVRILLVADPRARLARRAAELGSAGPTDVHDQVLRRDRDDAKVNDFERPADGVELIDSTDLTLDEVVALICERAERVA